MIASDHFSSNRGHSRGKVSQQLALFHAHYDSRCFLQIQIYEATTGRPVALILRPGKTPAGAEVALAVRHVVKALPARWPRVEILIRGDSHHARHPFLAISVRSLRPSSVATGSDVSSDVDPATPPGDSTTLPNRSASSNHPQPPEAPASR